MLYRILLQGVLVLSLVASLPTFALAQGDSKAAARVHFQKGVAAFNERRYAQAAEEFDTAYRLSPAYVVLYNIGQVNVALGNPVEAVNALDEYLKQGASSIPAERRDEVQREIEEQQSRIGSLDIVTRPEHAEVRIDGKLVGTSPLTAPIRVKAGRHTVEAHLPSRESQLRELDVAGKSTLTVELTFAKEPSPSATPSPAPTPAAPGAPAQPAPVVVQVETTTAAAPPAAAPSTSPSSELSQSTLVVHHTGGGLRINWLRTTGYVLAAGGVAVAVVGGIYALRGANEASDARTRMAAATTPEEYDAAQPAYDLGKARNQRGWIIAGCGGAGLLVGILIAAAAPDRSNTARIQPWLTAHGGGLELGHAF